MDVVLFFFRFLTRQNVNEARRLRLASPLITCGQVFPRGARAASRVRRLRFPVLFDVFELFSSSFRITINFVRPFTEGDSKLRFRAPRL